MKLARYFEQNPRQAMIVPQSIAYVGSEKVGQAVQQLGAEIDQYAQREETFWVQKQMMDLDSYAAEQWESGVANAGDGASGFQEGYLGALDTRYDEIRQQAPNGRARRQLEEQILRHRGGQANAAQGFATQEKYEFRKTTIMQDADNLAQEIYRDPGVMPWQPQGQLQTQPGLSSEFQPGTAEGFYSSGVVDEVNHVNAPENLGEWSSQFYSPRDFADGANMADKSGGIYVSKPVVAALDWATEQFGYGKLQINSGYRSSASNQERAESGPHGPHTKGQSVDIQVRHLPQAEKDRLYSLLKSAGFDSFGFGEGVLHAEMRGREASWTYGSAKPYSLIPVAGPTSSRGTSAAPSWSGDGPINQYPYLSAVALTARNETGSGDLAQASLQIAAEADGTFSVGALGLNSSGMLPAFIKENGEAMGLTAAPGSAEFAAQWEAAVRADPEGAIGRQLAFHESHVIRPAQASMQAMGAGSVVNDPRAVSFTSDLIIQYGPELARKHIAAGKGAADVAAYVNAVTASTKASLQSDFATAIAADPSVTQGLQNRIDRRAAGAMAAGPGGAIATGNVPAWSGPIPTIEEMPNFQARIERLDTMVDTMGGTPAQRREVKAQMRGQIVRAWLDRVAEVNPSAAMAVLMSGRYDEDLTIGDQQALMGGAQTAYKQIEADIRQKQLDLVNGLKVEASQLFADEIAAVTSTGKSLGRITDSHMAVATEREKSDLDFAGFAYQTSREISTAKDEDLPAILEALRPEGEGFAEEQRRYQFAQEQIAARREMQKNDPATLALQQSPDLQQQFTAAFANNDQAAIGAAIRTVRAAQERLGIPADQIKSMPQAAMVGFEELLTKAENADQAFANIMQLRGMFGAETPQILAEMEAAGLAKGWRQVSGLVDGGQALAAKSLARVVQAGEYGDDVEIGVRLATDGRADVARKIFDGRLRRKEIPGLMPTGKDDDLDVTIKQAVGDYLADAVGQDGAMFNAVREAALSLYAADLPFGASLDATKVEQALDAVTGGILQHNSDGATGRFVAPRPGMTQQEWNDQIWKLDDEALSGAFVGYSVDDEPMTRDDLAEIQFVSAGDGVYFLNWPEVGYARNADGTPYVFDFAKATAGALARAAAADKSNVELQEQARAAETDAMQTDLEAMRQTMQQIKGGQ
jgi:hypothetical protein